MTNEQAKSELMQIYGSLSEKMKQALDVLMAQADGEYQTKKSCETCKYGETFNLDCARCDDDMTNYAPKQADGEYISRQAVMDCYKKWQPYMATKLHEFEKELSELPSVAIPPKHDGCKDCVYQDNPEDAMPCRECKQNYMDKWKAKANKVGHWIIPKDIMWENPKCSECGFESADHDNYCPHCGCPMEIER